MGAPLPAPVAVIVAPSPAPSAAMAAREAAERAELRARPIDVRGELLGAAGAGFVGSWVPGASWLGVS